MIGDTRTTRTRQFGPPANQIGTDRNRRTTSATFARGGRNRQRFGTRLRRRARLARFIDEARPRDQIAANVRSGGPFGARPHSGRDPRVGQRRSGFPRRIEFRAGRSIAERDAAGAIFRLGLPLGRHLFRRFRRLLGRRRRRRRGRGRRGRRPEYLGAHHQLVLLVGHQRRRRRRGRTGCQCGQRGRIAAFDEFDAPLLDDDVGRRRVVPPDDALAHLQRNRRRLDELRRRTGRRKGARQELVLLGRRGRASAVGLQAVHHG